MRDVKFSWGCIGAGSAILLFIAALANNVRHDTNMAGAADAVENNCLATTDHTCASRTSGRGKTQRRDAHAVRG